MNKKKPKQKPEPKPEMFQTREHYCWLTGYPHNNGGNQTQKPIYEPLKIKL